MPLPPAPDQKPVIPARRQAASELKANNELLIKGILCVLIGLGVLVSPYFITSPGMAVGGWKEGWFVFTDEDGDGAFDSGADTVIRVQEAFANTGSFLAVSNAGGAVNNRNYISYDAYGRAVGLQSRWLVQAAGALGNDRSYTRTLCMNMVGRIRILAGEVSCA